MERCSSPGSEGTGDGVPTTPHPTQAWDIGAITLPGPALLVFIPKSRGLPGFVLVSQWSLRSF